MIIWWPSGPVPLPRRCLEHCPTLQRHSHMLQSWVPLGVHGEKAGEEAHRAVYALCIKSILHFAPCLTRHVETSHSLGHCLYLSFGTSCSLNGAEASNALSACFCARYVSYTHTLNRNNKHNMYCSITYWFHFTHPFFCHFNWVPNLVLWIHYTSYLLSPISFI